MILHYIFYNAVRYSILSYIRLAIQTMYENSSDLGDDAPTQYLSDTKLMGANSKIDLENVYDDPVLMKTRERDVIKASDDITAENRKISTLVYEIDLKRRMKDTRKHNVDRREARLNKRNERLQKQLSEKTEMLTRHEAQKEEIARLTDEFETLASDLHAALSELQSMTSDAAPAAEKKEDGAESGADDEDDTDPVRTIARLTHKIRQNKIEGSRVMIDNLKVEMERTELELEEEHLDKRLKQLEERYDVASKKKATPYDPVHFTEGIIKQKEKAADDLERHLAKSRVDALEYALQHEISSYNALKRENKRRSQDFRRWKKALELRAKKQELISKQVKKMEDKLSPAKKDKGEEKPKTLAASRSEENCESRVSFVYPEGEGPRTPVHHLRSPTSKIMARRRLETMIQERQDAYNEQVSLIQQMAEANEEARRPIQKLYKEKLEQLEKLTKKSDAMDKQFVKINTINDRIGHLMVMHKEMSEKLVKLKKERLGINRQVDESKGKQLFAEMSAALEAKEREYQAYEDIVKAKKEKYDVKKGDFDELRAQYDQRKQAMKDLDQKAQETNNQVEQAIKEVIHITRQLNIGLHYTAIVEKQD